jgi:hypothetical protein
MRRFGHPKGWLPRIGQPFYFSWWDRCGCGHMQHYEEAKVWSDAARPPHRELTKDQLRASRALKDRCAGMTSKKRRRWLAEQMGVDERFAVISEFDAVECATVLEICGLKEKAA